MKNETRINLAKRKRATKIKAIAGVIGILAGILACGFAEGSFYLPVVIPSLITCIISAIIVVMMECRK